jgi:hypothetical protein
VGEYVHESVRVTGSTGELEGKLLHFTCDSLSEHLRTLDRYTTLAARELLAKGSPVPMSRMVFDPAWTFVRTYVIRRGFSGRPAGAGDCVDGGALYVSQVRQGGRKERWEFGR